jgi:hypothetical protein
MRRFFDRYSRRRVEVKKNTIQPVVGKMGGNEVRVTQVFLIIIPGPI